MNKPIRSSLSILIPSHLITKILHFQNHRAKEQRCDSVAVLGYVNPDNFPESASLKRQVPL
jgi:hypothetical protein